MLMRLDKLFIYELNQAGFNIDFNALLVLYQKSRVTKKEHKQLYEQSVLKRAQKYSEAQRTQKGDV